MPLRAKIYNTNRKRFKTFVSRIYIVFPELHKKKNKVFSIFTQYAT